MIAVAEPKRLFVMKESLPFLHDRSQFTCTKHSGPQHHENAFHVRRIHGNTNFSQRPLPTLPRGGAGLKNRAGAFSGPLGSLVALFRQRPSAVVPPLQSQLLDFHLAGQYEAPSSTHMNETLKRRHSIAYTREANLAGSTAIRNTIGVGSDYLQSSR